MPNAAVNPLPQYCTPPLYKHSTHIENTAPYLCTNSAPHRQHPMTIWYTRVVFSDMYAIWSNICEINWSHDQEYGIAENIVQMQIQDFVRGGSKPGVWEQKPPGGESWYWGAGVIGPFSA